MNISTEQRKLFDELHNSRKEDIKTFEKQDYKGVSVGGMTNEQVMELYRVLTDIKYQLKSGKSSVESGGNAESGGFSVECLEID